MSSFPRQRSEPAVNASSMADIAFLLLVFFLVTTTIDIEKGIRVRLPPIDVPPPEPVHNRNVLSVHLNFNDELMVEGKPFSISDLREAAKLHITNPGARPDRAVRPKAAVVSLINDRGTGYDTYIAVYNELKAAYNELWEEEARRQHGLPFGKLSRSKQARIKSGFPMVISEGDLVDFEGGQ